MRAPLRKLGVGTGGPRGGFAGGRGGGGWAGGKMSGGWRGSKRGRGGAGGGGIRRPMSWANLVPEACSKVVGGFRRMYVSGGALGPRAGGGGW